MSESGLYVEPDPELLELLNRQLDKDERLVWSGTPASNAFVRHYRGIQLFGCLFIGASLLWMVFAFAITRSSTKPGEVPYLVPCFGLIFVVFGISLIVSIEWGERRSARGTIYGISTKRAIVIEGPYSGNVPEVFHYSAAQLVKVSRREARDGSGDLVFERVETGYGIGWGRRGSATPTKPIFRPRGFVGIQNVHEVERLLRSTLQVP